VCSSDLGARKIRDARLDSGEPKVGPLALPGTYTVKVTVDGQSQTTTLVVKQDPRLRVPAGDLAEQVKLALAIRDDISRLTMVVERLRALEKQAHERADLLKEDPKAAPLVRAVLALAAKCEALEGEMHNPKAEIVYDILAQRGGSRLYSRLSPLMSWVVDGDGAPTQGARQVYADQRKELDGYEVRFKAILADDLAAVNRQAASLGFAFIQ
jgi:hypothetical protein